MIDSHHLRYFFNLKLDKNGLTLFHKIILLDQIDMFNSILEAFKRRFLDEKGNESPKHKNSINSNKVPQNNEEKNSTDDGEIEDIKLSKLLSLKDKDGNSPILFAAYKGKVSIVSEDGSDVESIFEDLPKEVSIAIGTIDWGIDDASGLQEVEINDGEENGGEDTGD